jgi:hypothetical protein
LLLLLTAFAPITALAARHQIHTRGWAFLRNHVAMAPTGPVIAVATGLTSGKRWTLVVFAARDRLGAQQICTYVLVGPNAHTSNGGDGTCARLGAKAHALIEYDGNDSGVFGAVSEPAVALDAVDVRGKMHPIRLISAPKVSLPVRFFAIPAGVLLPEAFVARDANGRLLQQVPD